MALRGKDYSLPLFYLKCIIMHKEVVYMRSLVVYYSRTGVTKKVAEAISRKLGSDVEEIIDQRDRSGPKGYSINR